METEMQIPVIVRARLNIGARSSVTCSSQGYNSTTGTRLMYPAGVLCCWLARGPIYVAAQ